MSVFNLKMQNLAAISQEAQQKPFKFRKSPKGKLTLGSPLTNLKQRVNGRRHFLSLVVLTLHSYGV